jgi:hypothetical protein
MKPKLFGNYGAGENALGAHLPRCNANSFHQSLF